MKYEISTVSSLKADIVNAMHLGVILDKGDLASFEAFDAAVDAYVGMCRDAGPSVIRDEAVPAIRTRRAWFNELKSAT